MVLELSYLAESNYQTLSHSQAINLHCGLSFETAIDLPVFDL